MDPAARDLLARLGLWRTDAGAPPAPETLQLDDDGVVPNSRLPTLLYRGDARASGDPATAFEALFSAHAWPPQWRGGVFAFDHYHSTAHEVLGVAGGRAEIRLGGSRGPTVQVDAGDVVVLPAGTGHCRIAADDAFAVVGAYPRNQPYWDILRAEPDTHDTALASIARVPLPDSDPVAGTDGPLMHIWMAT